MLAWCSTLPLPCREHQIELAPQYKDAARTRAVELSIVAVAGPQEIPSAVNGAKAAGIEALNVLATPLFGSYQTRGIVLESAASLRLPAIYQ
jgi:hypothetical protein